MSNIKCGMIPTFGDSAVIKLFTAPGGDHSAPGGGHYGSTHTARKVLDCGLYWPTIFKDAYQFISTYDKC
ncbi:hypothetical protein CR513_54627, partial [Mucuna pruriens]